VGKEISIWSRLSCLNKGFKPLEYNMSIRQYNASNWVTTQLFNLSRHGQFKMIRGDGITGEER